MTIAEIEAKLTDPGRDDGRLVLSEIDVCGPLCDALFKGEDAGAPTLTATTAPEFSPDHRVIRISGKASLGGVAEVDITLVFAAVTGGVGVHLIAALPEQQVVTLPGLESLAIGNLELILDVTAGGYITGRLKARVPFKDSRQASMPIAVELPLSTADWAFIGGIDQDIDAIDPVDGGPGGAAVAQIPLTLPDLARLLNLSSLASALPEGLSAIGLTGFSFVFSGEKITSLSLGLASVDEWSWQVGQLMTVDRLQLGISVVDPWGDPRYVVGLAGRLKAGKKGWLELQAGATREWSRSQDDGGWTFQGFLPEVEIPSGLKIENLSLKLSQKDAGAWGVAGDLDVHLFDREKPVHLHGESTIDHESVDLRFQADDLNLRVLELPQCGGAFLLDTLSIGIRERKVDRAAPSGEPSFAFDLECKARLQWAEGGELSGVLSLSTDSENPHLSFEIDGSATVTLPGPEGLRHPQITFEKGRVEIAKDEEAGWYFDGSTSFCITNLTDRIQSAMPSEATECGLKLTSKSLEFRIENPFPPAAVPLPATGGSSPRGLGKVQVGMQSLTVTVQSHGAELDATLALRLPDELNDLFGRRSDKSRREIFVTDRDIRVTFGAGLIDGQPGFSIRFIDLPFNLFEEGPDGMQRLDLGEAGAVDFTLPSLTCTAGSFKLSIDLLEDKDRPLRLPLTILKALLAGRLPDDVVKLLPDYVPLTADSLFDDAVGLDAGKLVKRFDLPDEVASGLQSIQKAAKNLPDRFKDYLRAQRPTGLKLAVDITPAGSVSLDLAFKDKPVRVLLPALPNLIGLELSKLSFGEMLGGALFRLNLDARFDSFDLASLAICAGAKETAADLDYLSRMQDTFFANNLLMFIVYETGIPIPIPVFCDKLGFEYLGLLGVEARSSWSFPEPELGLPELLGLGTGLWNFVSDRDACFPTDLKMPFGLGESYISLPPYFGPDKYIGVKGHDVFHEDACELFAHVADGIKFFSLYDALRAIPFEWRAQSLDLSLGPLQVNASGLVCTAREFGEQFGEGAAKLPPSIASLARLPADEKREFLQIASGEGSAPVDEKDERRLVILLSGGCGISGLSSLEASFALVAGGDCGFFTSTRLNGQLANELSVDLRGSVSSESGTVTGDATFCIRANGELRVGGHPVLTASGEARVERQDGLVFHGKLDALPDFPELTFSGAGTASFSASGLKIGGQARVNVLGIQGEAEFAVTPSAFSVTESASGLAFGLWKSTVGLKGTNLCDRASIRVTGTLQQKSDLATWATQVRAQLTKLGMQKLTEFRRQIAKALDGYAHESWRTWILHPDHAIADADLRLIDAYVASLQSALEGTGKVADAVARIVDEVAARLGPLGTLVVPLAFGSWAPSFSSATFTAELTRTDGQVTLTVTGSLPGGKAESSWTFAADLRDVASIAAGLALKMIA